MAFPILLIFSVEKGLLLVWHLGGLFLAFQLGLLYFGFSLLFLQFCLEKLTVGTFITLSFNFSITESLCKNIPLNIRVIVEANKIWLQNPYVGFVTFCIINLYGLECFRCVCHDLFSRFFFNGYHLFGVLLDLVSCSSTIVLVKQQISEDIWDGIQFYLFLCAWNLWVFFCILFLSVAWRCAFKC